VYAIDVGYGQLDWKLRSDPRVVVMDRTNARYVEALPEPIDVAVVDASFISLRLILSAVLKWLQAEVHVITLIKPQFEAGRAKVVWYVIPLCLPKCCGRCGRRWARSGSARSI